MAVARGGVWLRTAASAVRRHRTLATSVAGASAALASVVHSDGITGEALYARLFPGGQGPRADRRPHYIEVHGDMRTDFYYWLRDDKRQDKDVLDICKAENDHTDVAMAGTEALQETLYKEMRGRIQEKDEGVPVRRNGYLYYQRTEENKQYPLHCRRKLSPAQAAAYSAEETIDSGCGPEEVLLDENEEAAKSDGDYYQCATFRPSPSNRYIAICEDRKGDELQTLMFLDTQPPGGKAPMRLAEAIPTCSGSVAWVDDTTLFYATQDAELHRSDKVWRHTLGTPPGQDVLVSQDDDEAFNMYVARSRSGNHIYVGSSSSITSDIQIIPCARPTEKPQPTLGRTKGVEYDVDDRAGQLFVLTNKNAINSKLLRLDLKTKKATEVLPHRDNVKLEDLTLYNKHMAVTERYDGVSHVRVFEFENETSSAIKSSDLVPVDEESYTMWVRFTEFNSTVLRFGYSSLTTPMSVFDVDMNDLAKKAVLKKQQPVLGGFDSSNYVTRRLWATSHDGTRVPISLVHRKDKPPGPAPTFLDGYGSYEISNDAFFSSNRISLLDRGVTFAIAHVRGGGEMGRKWYEDAKYLKKENTWRDFIACSETLIAEGVTDADRLCIYGASAGGLLIGATLNTAPKRPDGRPFFAGAIANVPFVDCLTTMLDPSIPLTVGEYDEWGCPNEEPYYHYMKSYSPVDNVHPSCGPYPPILIKGGLHDPRVGYWEPLKYAQVLRDAGARNVICKINMGAGHFAQSGRFDRLKETALDYAFCLRALGLENATPAK